MQVRANKGFAGMRPWLQRYFVLCNHDFTLRRYVSADEVDAPKKAPRVYSVADIESVEKDLPPRFSLHMKSKRVGAGAEGDVIKLAAETEAERLVRAPVLRGNARRARVSLKCSWLVLRRPVVTRHVPPRPLCCGRWFAVCRRGSTR